MRRILLTVSILAVMGFAVQGAQAGPRVTIGNLVLANSVTAATCSTTALAAARAFFPDATLPASGNAHGVDDNFTLILYCEASAHHAYVVIGGLPNVTMEDTSGLKDKIKAKFIELLPGTTPG